MKKLFAPALFFLLAACTGSKEGSEFIGEWHHSEDSSDILLIAQHDEGFVVKRIKPSPFSGKPMERTLPARYENRSLIAMPLAPITHDGQSDTLSLGLSTYQRAK